MRKLNNKQMKKALSKPMTYYKSVFVRHKTHKLLIKIKNEHKLKSMSDAIELILNNVKKNIKK